MKTTKIISLFTIAFLVITAFNTLHAEEASKTIRKEFQVKKDATLLVENRFGKIHCNVWDKNEIEIEVVITAKANNMREAERLIDRVSIDISGNSNKVEAITSMQDKATMDNKSSLTIDYTINMPSTINLLLTNKFGDIFVDKNTGTSNINLDYGNLQINTLRGSDHKLNMRFSKGILGESENLTLDMSYSEFSADEINDLVIDSKFSTFEVTNAKSIRHDSQYDTNRLGSSESLKTTAKFSTITIGSISEMLDLDVRYGGCTVKEIGADFKEVIINNSFGNVSLRFDENASFNLDAQSNFGGVSFPGNSNVSVEEVSFTSKSYKGVVGKDGKTTSTVIISTRNGDVSLKMK